MFAVIVGAAALACGTAPITLEQAKQLVLAAPNIRASVDQRHARPFFEYVEAGPMGWSFDVKARNPCSGRGQCSNLLGHYAVSRRTATVEDLDAGSDGRVVTSARMAALRRRFQHKACGPRP
jgi:hypothetical protein